MTLSSKLSKFNKCQPRLQILLISRVFEPLYHMSYALFINKLSKGLIKLQHFLSGVHEFGSSVVNGNPRESFHNLVHETSPLL